MIEFYRNTFEIHQPPKAIKKDPHTKLCMNPSNPILGLFLKLQLKP